MLGLFLLYFIGKNYAELAGQFGKQKWVYIIIGILSYYAGTFLFGIILGFINPEFVLQDGNDLELGLMSIPFGIGLCVTVY